MASIKRRAHIIRREKTLAMPRAVIFYDTETKQTELEDGSIEQTIKLGWACHYQRAYGRHIAKTQWHFFRDALAFWQFVYKYMHRKQKLWVISHNLNFDFTVVNGWHYLNQAGFKLKFLHNSGTNCIISVRSRYGSIVFVDFMNWFPEPLEAIGNRIGIPKIKVDFATCTDEQLSLHCKRDVEILLAAFKDFCSFLEEYHVSRLCFTRASTSMAAYLLNYYDHKIYIHNNSEAIDLERASYRGGRTECFFLGGLNSENYYVLDVNSLYPCVMYHNLFPCKYEKISGEVTPKELGSVLSAKAVIARVLIETDEPAYAVKSKRTIFPVGRFWVTLCTPELVYAIKHKHLVKVDQAVFYEQAPLFARYVKRFYVLRQEFKQAGQASYDVFCKYLLNSFYGKFGQKAEVWKKIGVCPGQPNRTELACYPAENRRGLIRYLLGDIWELVGYEESFNSFPAISSHVTAYGRMYLYQLMKTAGAGNYFYCDTDSLIVNEVGLCKLESLLNDTSLGCLKIEQRSRNIIIKGLKDYTIETKRVVKGVRANAQEVADGVYVQEVWPSLRGLLRTGETGVYTVKTQTRRLDRKYTKGYVSSDGQISPLELYELDVPALWTA